MLQHYNSVHVPKSLVELFTCSTILCSTYISQHRLRYNILKREQMQLIPAFQRLEPSYIS
eukprot:c36325_g1_i1 orf=1-177(-)